MIRVRRATITDLPRMVQIAKRAVTAAQWNEKHYAELFTSGRIVLVIEEESRVMGRT